MGPLSAATWMLRPLLMKTMKRCAPGWSDCPMGYFRIMANRVTDFDGLSRQNVFHGVFASGISWVDLRRVQICWCILQPSWDFVLPGSESRDAIVAIGTFVAQRPSGVPNGKHLQCLLWSLTTIMLRKVSSVASETHWHSQHDFWPFDPQSWLLEE